MSWCADRHDLRSLPGTTPGGAPRREYRSDRPAGSPSPPPKWTTWLLVAGPILAVDLLLPSALSWLLSLLPLVVIAGLFLWSGRMRRLAGVSGMGRSRGNKSWRQSERTFR